MTYVVHLRDCNSCPNKASCRLLRQILSVNHGGLGLNQSQWPTVWFKGGSEPGVLTLGYLARNSKGQSFVVSTMLSNPNSVLAPSAIGALLEVAKGAFELVG